MNTPAPVGITMGDAAGIGPELVVKACAQGLNAPCVVYGDAGALRRAAAALGARLEIREITNVGQASGDAGRIEVVACGPALPPDLPHGKVSAAAGRAAYDYVCAAIDDAQAGRIRAIVTAPLNKQSMHEAGIDYPGHTEILAERSGTDDFAMMLANDELRVLLVTIHVALADVMARITPEAELTAMRLADRACRQMGIARPRVAVAGLNPHAGEGGKFGREDIDIIEPAIRQARDQGIDASGPWPGDTVFMRARRGEFDIVVAQYHDQGLIPVKYLGVDHGVNVTVGLPFVRTSVDHGTAFDIAGKGVADPASLIAAFDLALAMTP
ncbi:4-hydroxythreonine-4-phosphate dehydrogenase PdxA [Achromobacter ruhlandii]|uniref:4-hydroxythreonine-4-phosphate dehydrogenase PdxA n=2 Tax=Achromobacter TaxID=222 RepID=A0AAU7L871_9BURK|nr:4-hydroxythreonine-4-phosphate dehydrogenase PdxA [Achromobacter ruhlandii]MCI1839877.1 4-hydroxythreonine-4-phosphate dehydrogenase PdxA [Achromobacter ruhlandii]